MALHLLLLIYKIYSISDWICKDMAIEISLIQGNVCLCHCLHFSTLAYDLTRRSRCRIYKLNAKTERAD